MARGLENLTMTFARKNETPTPRALNIWPILVARVLSWGGNQVAEIWMGAAMKIGAPIPLMEAPR